MVNKPKAGRYSLKSLRARISKIDEKARKIEHTRSGHMAEVAMCNIEMQELLLERRDIVSEIARKVNKQ